MQIRTGGARLLQSSRTLNLTRQNCHICLSSSSTSIIPSNHHHIRSLHTSPRNNSAWAAAVQVATNMASNVVKQGAKDHASMHIDPLRTVAKEMAFLKGNIRKLLGSGHPSLDKVAKYYMQAEGKNIRPLIVLLMSRATHLCPKNNNNSQTSNNISSTTIDTSISPVHILSDFNPSATPLTNNDDLPETENSDILPTQRRLAEITELIHTASLLHDDVIDHSVSRRGSPSANLEFGNKMAVLAGDFLLGRASVALARLRNPEVIELLATVIANLVEGEFMQMKNTERDERRPQYTDETLAYYLQKTYLKTASLISKSCRAAALLGGSDAVTVDAAYSYGRNLGLAFQLVDDMLDYTRSDKELGKPAGADLELGLATAPLLFAWKQMPELGDLVGRKFSKDGDVEKAREAVIRSDGVEQTRALAQSYSEKAMAAIAHFPESEAKDGLIDMAQKTIKRQK